MSCYYKLFKSNKKTHTNIKGWHINLFTNYWPEKRNVYMWHLVLPLDLVTNIFSYIVLVHLLWSTIHQMHLLMTLQVATICCINFSVILLKLASQITEENWRLSALTTSVWLVCWITSFVCVMKTLCALKIAKQW